MDPLGEEKFFDIELWTAAEIPWKVDRTSRSEVCALEMENFVKDILEKYYQQNMSQKGFAF